MKRILFIFCIALLFSACPMLINPPAAGIKDPIIVQAYGINIPLNQIWYLSSTGLKATDDAATFYCNIDCALLGARLIVSNNTIETNTTLTVLKNDIPIFSIGIIPMSNYILQKSNFNIFISNAQTNYVNSNWIFQAGDSVKVQYDTTVPAGIYHGDMVDIRVQVKLTN